MNGLVWTSIVSAVLGALAVIVGVVSLVTGSDAATPLIIALGGASISLAILAARAD